MRKKKVEEKSHSIRTLVLYGIIVFCLILASFSVRVFSLINESKFDGQHRFTIVIGEELSNSKQGGRVLGIISFEPMSSSLSLLTFPRGSKSPFSNLNRSLGIIPDGYIKTRYNLVLGDTIPPLFQSFLFRSNSISTNINYYDLLQLYLYSTKVPVSTVAIEELPVATDIRAINKTLPLLLTDSFISSENVSVQIINAAGESGLGGRLERVITNLGGNVVSVKTAKVTERVSKIQYYGRETYTLQKLERLLRMKKEILTKEAIAKIIIIVGEDNKNTLLF